MSNDAVVLKSNKYGLTLQLDGTIPLDDIHYSEKKDYHMMIELDDFKESVINGQTSFFHWLKDFVHSDSYLYLDKNDMGPFVAMCIRKTLNAFRVIMRMKKL